MSSSNLNKSTSTENDDKDISDFDGKENSDTTIDMDMVEQKETVEPGEIKIAENSIKLMADKNEATLIDLGNLIDLKALKISIISEVASRRKYTIMAMFQNLFGPSQPPTPQQQQMLLQQQQLLQQHQQQHRVQLWRQVPPPPQQQSLWSQYGPGQPAYEDTAGNEGYPLIYEPSSRNSFVALVMTLVFIMLVGTAGFLAIVLSKPELKEFFQIAGWPLLLLAFVGITTIQIAMFCSPCARRPPCNFVCLLLATCFMSILAAWVTSHYRTEIILYAFLTTGAVVFVCILLACSKFDFTSRLLYIIVIATAFSVIVMIVMITMLLTGTMMKPIILVILVVGGLIQSVMLIMELQMILGGRRVEISEADYAIAAFMIYTSILDIFLRMVHIFGLTSD